MKRCPVREVAWTLFEVIFDLPRLQSQLKELEERQAFPGFWDDAAEAQKVLQKSARLRDLINPFVTLDKRERDIQEFFEILKEEPDEDLQIEAERNALEFLSDLDRYELQTLLSG